MYIIIVFKNNVTQNEQPISIYTYVAVYFNIWGKSSQVYGDRALNFVLVSIDQVTIHGNKQQKYKNDINETFLINNTNLGTNCLESVQLFKS